MKKILRTVSFDKETIDILTKKAEGQGLPLSTYINWFIREKLGLNSKEE